MKWAGLSMSCSLMRSQQLWKKKKRIKSWHLLKKPLMRNSNELTKLKPLPMKGSYKNLLLWARYNVKVRRHLPSSHISQSLKILAELAAWKPCKQHWVYVLKMPSKHTSLDQTSTALTAHLEKEKKSHEGCNKTPSKMCSQPKKQNKTQQLRIKRHSQPLTAYWD